MKEKKKKEKHIKRRRRRMAVVGGGLTLPKRNSYELHSCCSRICVPDLFYYAACRVYDEKKGLLTKFRINHSNNASTNTYYYHFRFRQIHQALLGKRPKRFCSSSSYRSRIAVQFGFPTPVSGFTPISST